ncbi:MAG: alpha/beta hydrolase [Actinomycetota bacterium]|nr:alpha/beta hydrolase [Actinomycetota bacterium]
MRTGSVEANGIEFAYLEAGEGPLVLLLHGFPDDAHTWSSQIDALAGAGYRAVAPFMRGYPPTGPAPDGRYDAEALAADVAGLIDALGDGPALVAGNDWGGIATHAASALHPELVRRALVINIGHPATFFSTLLHPRQIHHVFHFWFFQQHEIAAGAMRANDFALADYLWDYWSAPGHDYADHLARVKRETLAPEGGVEGGLSYYPALVRLPQTHPAVAERIQGRYTVPTLTIFGDHDPPRELSEGEHVHFEADYRLEIVAGAGHFVHRERPGEVNRLMLDWFGEGGTA